MFRTLCLAIVCSLATGCGAGEDSSRSALPDEASSTLGTVAEPARRNPCDSAGPWTACPEAAWVRRVVAAADYRVGGDTGSALVAEGRGDSFYIWTTPAVRPVADMLDGGDWSVLGVVEGAEIYGDDDLWRWWVSGGRVFWVKAGPSASSTVPDVDELDALVAASRRIEPPER